MPSIKVWSLPWRSSSQSSPQSPLDVFVRVQKASRVSLECFAGSRRCQKNSALNLGLVAVASSFSSWLVMLVGRVQ